MIVGHVISGIPARSGGTTKAIMDMARWQALLGADCTLLSADEPGPHLPFEPLTQAGVKLARFPILGSRQWRYLSGFAAHLRNHARDFDLMILHGSYQYPPAAAAAACRKAGIPYIFMPHGSLDPVVRHVHPLRNRLIDALYHDDVIQRAAAWHFTSLQEQTRCDRKLWTDAFIAPLGLDIPDFHEGAMPGRFRARFGIPRERKLLLFLSRITYKKGIDILLPAFRRLVGEGHDVQLVLAGPVDDDQKPLVDAAASDPAIKDRMTLTGMILDQAKDDAFLDADFFVLPTYTENFGIAVFEAIGYGNPAITTTGMDLHREIGGSGRALITEPREDTLLDALRDAVTGTWRPAVDADAGRRWLEENFAWKPRAQDMLDHYAHVVARHRTRVAA